MSITFCIRTYISLAVRVGTYINWLACKYPYIATVAETHAQHTRIHTPSHAPQHTHTHTHTHKEASTHTHRHALALGFAFMHASLRMHVYLCVHVSTHRHIPALSFAHRTGPLLWTKSSTSPPCRRDGYLRRMRLCASADPKPIVAPVHAAFLVLCVDRPAPTRCLDISLGARMRDTCVSRGPCERRRCLGDCWTAPAGRMWLQKELLWCLSKF